MGCVTSKLRHLCTAVHLRPCAVPSQHVRIACLLHLPRALLSFHAQVCKHRFASVCRLLTVLAGPISSLSMEVVEVCLVGLPIGLALQPARVISFPALSLSRESTARPELGTCACGPRDHREPSASRSQWSETASEGVPSSSVLPSECARARLFVVLIVQFFERLA